MHIPVQPTSTPLFAVTHRLFQILLKVTPDSATIVDATLEL